MPFAHCLWQCIRTKLTNIEIVVINKKEAATKTISSGSSLKSFRILLSDKIFLIVSLFEEQNETVRYAYIPCVVSPFPADNRSRQ
jgi:hypothetical protein